MRAEPLSALRILTPEALDKLADAAGRLSSASTVPFLEITDAFADDLLADLLLEMPKPGSRAALLPLRALGRGFRRLDELFGCPELIELMGRIAGERYLVHDFDYEFAGLRQVTEAAPQRLTLGMHPRGWHRRLTAIVCLDSAWIPGGGPREKLPARLPAASCRLVIVPTEDWYSDFQLLPPAGADETRCRYVVVHFYAQGLGAGSAARRSSATTEEKAPSLLQRLRETAGDGLQTHGQLTAELSRQAFELQRHAGQVFQRLERYRDALWLPCCDGTTAISETELATFVRVPELWQAALTALDNAERSVEEVATEAAGFPPLPIAGEASIDQQFGRWRDGWVGPRWAVRVVPHKPIRAIVLEGTVPEPLRSAQRLFATVSECVHQLLPPIGSFVWRFVVTDAPAEAIMLRVTAAKTWRPADAGDSPDARPLAWHLSRISIET
jgi:hypothetical protein